MMRFVSILVTACAVVALPGAAFADDKANIKYRQAIMKAVAGHGGALGAIAKGSVPHSSHAAAHAEALKGLSRQVLAAFEAKTEGESRSKPNVWSDWAGFEKANSDFVSAADAVAAAVAGDGDMGAAMKDLFGSCKACHKDYRAKKK